MNNRLQKKPGADIRSYYSIIFQSSLIIVLLLIIGLTKIDLRAKEKSAAMTDQQEVVKMEDIEMTKHDEKPPPPPRPPVPVEVPNDEVLEDQILNLDAEIDLDEPLATPPPPSGDSSDEEDFFVVVEQMPKIKGGIAAIQSCANYPDMARKAGIEGRVTIQFIVNENGEVENPRILRGIGGGADEEALRCVKQAEFTPGMQRGKPVRVQFSVPVIFRLGSSK